MISVSQIIMPYTLNLYSAVYQLYLNKTGREKIIDYLLWANTKRSEQIVPRA